MVVSDDGGCRCRVSSAGSGAAIAVMLVFWAIVIKLMMVEMMIEITRLW